MRLALIGAGRHGSRYLLPENGLLRERFPGSGGIIHSVCSNEHETEELLRSPHTADGVIIATRADSHAELAIRCLRAGLHVIVEKPAALRWGDVQAMTDCADREKRTLLVAHTHLFARGWRVLEPSEQKDASVRIGGPRPERDMASVSAMVDWGSHAVAMAMALCWPQRLAPVPIDGAGWRVSRRGGYLLELGGGDAAVSVECGDFHQRELMVSNGYMGGYSGGCKSEPGTSIFRMVATFLRVCSGEPDFRVSPEFTRAVYQAVLA